MLYPLARAALFKLEPEAAHGLALKLLRAIGPGAALLGAGPRESAGETRNVMGIAFPNPVGLAAGLDKNGEYIDALAALGFGFLEIGTVTPRPQPGNPPPRIFRLEEHDAIINRLGFNSQGVERLLRNVERARFRGVLGINIGKNADTPIERAAEDYLQCLEAVYERATYVAVNISSPNTRGLRELQSGDLLDELLGAVMAKRASLAQRHARTKPLLVKVAPDLDEPQLERIAELAVKHGVDGLIATNTTTGRAPVAGHRHAPQAGGLSGGPLFEPSTQVLRELSRLLAGRIPLVGVGGILSGAQAREKIEAGASLVQIYTGFIYRGPRLIADSRRAIAR